VGDRGMDGEAAVRLEKMEEGALALHQRAGPGGEAGAVHRREAPELDQDPVGGPEPPVGPVAVLPAPREGHRAALALAEGDGQGRELGVDEFLEAQTTGGDEVQGLGHERSGYSSSIRRPRRSEVLTIPTTFSSRRTRRRWTCSSTRVSARSETGVSSTT